MKQAADIYAFLEPASDGVDAYSRTFSRPSTTQRAQPGGSQAPLHLQKGGYGQVKAVYGQT